MVEIDAVDHKILELLQQDGRMSNAELAERINLSPSACLRRVRRLEDDGVIDRYAMIINPKAIGRTSNIFVEITLKSQHEESLNEFEEAVAKCPGVMSCHLMSGDFDYMLRIAVTGATEYEHIHKSYLARLPFVDRIRSNFALRTVCNRTTFKFA